MLSRYHRQIRATEAAAASGGLVYDPRPRLFPAALAGFDDPTRHRAWRWARGSAKTTTGQYAHLEAAMATPRVATVYLSDTIGRAKAVVWDELVEWALPLGGKSNANDLVIRFPNRSRIFVTGADKIKTFNRKRGIKRLVFVHFDECQDWEPEVLKYAVTKVFMPRLGDVEKLYGFKGRILLSGTGMKDAGYFHDVCTKPEFGFGVTTATQWDNPHLADPDGEFREACQGAGALCIELPPEQWVASRFPGGRPRKVDSPDPMVRREFFAEFNSGGSLQVFQGTPVLVPRSSLPTRDLQLVVTADYGTVDACAVGAWLFSRHDQRKYLVEARREVGLSASRQVSFVRQCALEWRERYQPTFQPTLVGDGGGLGKALIMDLQEAEGAWDVEAAEKQDKVPNIRIMAGDMRDGAWAVVEDLKWFADLLKGPEWDPEHVGEKLKGHMPDEIDMAYMGYRKAKMLHILAPPVPPPLNEDQREQEALARERREGAKRGRAMMGGRGALDAWKR